MKNIEETREGVTIIRLSAPMMAWPTPGQYRTKGTYNTPTYSALLGLLHAAAGIPRGHTPPPHLDNPPIAVRIDTKGIIGSDYQTVNPPPLNQYQHLTEKDQKELATVRKPDGLIDRNAIIIEKSYTQGQTVLVAYSDPDQKILHTFTHPQWALYAGRKSCILTHPFIIGHLPNVNIFNVFNLIPTIQPPTPTQTNQTTTPPPTPTIFFTPPPPTHTHPTQTEKRYDQPAEGDNVGKNYKHKTRWNTYTQPPTAVENYYQLINHINQLNNKPTPTTAISGEHYG